MAVCFTDGAMSLGTFDDQARPRVRALVTGIASNLGQEVREERLRRRWRLLDVAERAGESPSLVHKVEAGEYSSLVGYVRLRVALGLEPRFTLRNDRLPGPARDVDSVPPAMGGGE